MVYAPRKSLFQASGHSHCLSPAVMLIYLSTVLWGLVGGSSPASAQGVAAVRVVYVGVLTAHDRTAIRQQWMPTMDYLSAQVPGTRFVALPVDLAELGDALQAKKFDFVLVNPAFTGVLKSEYGLSSVATLVNQGHGIPLNKFGGVVFTRRHQRDIQTLADIRGRTIAISEQESFDGFRIHQDLLKTYGIDVTKDSRLLMLGLPQERSVRAVLDGRADVGFVRTGVLESMAGSGRLDISQIRVLHELSRPEFPFRLSTRLYPEWILASAPQASMPLIKQVAAALLVMKPDDEAARENNYAGWSPPLSPANPVHAGNEPGVDGGGDADGWRTMHRYLDRHVVETMLGVFSLFIVTLMMLYLHARHVNHTLSSSQKKLQVMAHHDALTGLPNRVLLDERLSLALAQAKRSGREVAVCLLDLDGFKPLNDTFGHLIGDRALQEVAARIKGCLRESDMVARYGGDEFVLVLDDFVDQRQLKEVVERVLLALAQPLACHPGARIRASIGVSIYPEDAIDAFGLLKHADEAMYAAKRDGGNRFVIHANLTTVLPRPILFRKA